MNTSGKAAVEKLTYSWYGCVVSASALSFFLLDRGLISAAIGLVISLAIVTYIGRRLEKGSNGMRVFCMVMSGLGLLSYSYSAYRAAAWFLSYWSITYLAAAVLCVIYVYMNFKSLRVLLRADVRKHCES